MLGFPYKKHLLPCFRYSEKGSQCFAVRFSSHFQGSVRKTYQNDDRPFSFRLSFSLRRLTTSISVNSFASIQPKCLCSAKGVEANNGEKKTESESLHQRIARQLAVLRHPYRISTSCSIENSKKVEKEEKNSDPAVWRRAMALFQSIPYMPSTVGHSVCAPAFPFEKGAQGLEDRILLEHLLFTLFRLQAPSTVCHSVYLIYRQFGWRREALPRTSSDKRQTGSVRRPFHSKGLYFHYASYLSQQGAVAASQGEFSKALFFVSRSLLVLLMHAPMDQSPYSLRPSMMILGLQTLHEWERYQWVSQRLNRTHHGTSTATRGRPNAVCSSHEVLGEGGEKTNENIRMYRVKEPMGEEACFSQWLEEKGYSSKAERNQGANEMGDTLKSIPGVFDSPSFSSPECVLISSLVSPHCYGKISHAGEVGHSLLYQLCTHPSTPPLTLLEGIRLFFSLDSPFSSKKEEEGAYFPLPPLARRTSSASITPHHHTYQGIHSTGDDSGGPTSRHSRHEEAESSTCGRAKHEERHRHASTSLWCVTDYTSSKFERRGNYHRLIPHWGAMLWNKNVSFAIASTTHVAALLHFLKEEGDVKQMVSRSFPFCVFHPPSAASLHRKEDGVEFTAKDGNFTSKEFHASLKRALFLVLDFPLDSEMKMWMRPKGFPSNVDIMSSPSHMLEYLEQKPALRTPSSSFSKEEPRRFCSLVGWFTHLLIESVALIRDVEGVQSARWFTHSQLVSDTLQDIFFLLKRARKHFPNASSLSCTPKEAEQEVWSKVLDGVLRGVFCLEVEPREETGGIVSKRKVGSQRGNANVQHMEESMNASNNMTTTCNFPTCSLPGMNSIPVRLRWIPALYDASQWQIPTVNAYIVILHEWKQSNAMVEVFRSVQQKERYSLKALRTWITTSAYGSSELDYRVIPFSNPSDSLKGDEARHKLMKGNSYKKDNEMSTSLLGKDTCTRPSVLWQYTPSLSLLSCATIIEHCCTDLQNGETGEGGEAGLRAKDPFLARDVLKYMLAHLLLLQHRGDALDTMREVAILPISESARRNNDHNHNESHRMVYDAHQINQTKIECSRWRSWIESTGIPMIIETVKQLKMKVTPEEWVLG